MRNFSWLLIAGLCIIMLCSGCGGGSTTPPSGTRVHIGTDTSRVTRSVLTTPLAPGSTVEVRNFVTGSLITSGTVGADGFASLNVPGGLCVMIIAKGTEGGKPFRLSRILARVPALDTEVILSPVSSLATEAIAAEYYAQGLIIDTATVTTVTTAAEAYVAAHPNADFSLNGSLLTGTDVGTLDTTALATVVDAVPDTLDNATTKGKNAVQQVREAGVPLAAMTENEQPVIEGMLNDAIMPLYENIGTRLWKLIVPLTLQTTPYLSTRTVPSTMVRIFDLTIGRGYRATAVRTFGTSYLQLTDAPEFDTPGQITVKFDADGGTYTLVATHPTGQNWHLVQTFTGDATLSYLIDMPYVEQLGTNPTLTMSASMTDAAYPTPLTFNGTVSATGVDMDHYTRVTFSGTATAPGITADGSATIDFPATLPTGAPLDATIYQYPSRLDVQNAHFTVQYAQTTLELSGSLLLTTVVVMRDGKPCVLPNHLEFSGEYGNSASGLDFTGSIDGDWTNVAADMVEADMNGNLHLHGLLHREGYYDYTADLTYAQQNGSVTLTIALEQGTDTLAGTITTTMTEYGPLGGHLTLTNQDGVVIEMTYNWLTMGITGNIKADATQVATINLVGSNLRITYNDGTYEEFPL